MATPGASSSLEAGHFVDAVGSWPQRTTIQHWQLRDLVSCGQADDEFYTVSGKQALSYDTTVGQAFAVQSLDYAPTSMTVGHGYLASGGQQSELSVTSLEDNTCIYDGVAGGTVNNALHIARGPSAGDIWLLVSNNNDTIKILSLPAMAHLDTVYCDVAINYTAVNPSGTYMACVGDSRQAYLYSIKNGCQKIAAYTEASDHGMCCSWNAAGNAFAAASQDGTVCVWDIRFGKVLAKFQSKEGACRVVKYTRGPHDLLAFSEHTSFVHVVDSRTYDKRQTIRLGDEENEPHISGLAFTKDASQLFVGTEDCVLQYSVDSMGRRGFPCGFLYDR